MQHRHTAQTQGQPEFVEELVMPCEGLMLMISTVLFGDFNMHVGIDAGPTMKVTERLEAPGNPKGESPSRKSIQN